MNVHELSRLFKGVKRNGSDSYKCICPIHNDKKASLVITEKNNVLLLHCHAGCKTEDILNSVGLTFKDISGKKERTEYNWKQRLEYKVGKKIEDVYDYCDINKRYLYSKVRFEDKYIRYVRIDRVNDRYQFGKGECIETLYNIYNLVKTVRNGFPVFIVEGEKDVNTLTSLGLTATTAGSASDWKKEYAQFFTGAKVIILPDNDEPGLGLKNKIIKDLKHYAHSVQWCITSNMKKGDVTDFIKKEGKKLDDLKKIINNSDIVYAPWVDTSSKKIKINPGILADSISRGLPYKIVRRPDEEKDDFYFYENGVYSKCNRNKVKSIIMRYIPNEYINDNIINNVCNLLMCQENNLCTYRDLDKNEMYINLQNGLYNIKEKKLERHTPEILSTIQIKCDYNPDLRYKPVFERYINEFCKDVNGNIDEGKKQIIQEYGGIVLSNVNVYRTKVALVLYSILGNTGKSQLINLITELLGDDKTANIPIQNMNEASKFALGEIVGKRMISVGDQTSNEIKDSAVFKQLTGGDDVKVEKKSKQPYSYRYPGGIIIACNNLPTFTDDKGGHLFQRLCIIPCENVISEKDRDPMILDKMLKEKSAIFNWFLEGLHRLIDNNYKLTKSQSSILASTEYRSKMDTVYRFLCERYIITEDKADMVSKPDFENEYIKWCQMNGFTNVNKQNIKDRMEGNGCKSAKANFNGLRGVMVYRCLKEKPSDFVNIENDDEDQTPF